MKYVLNEKTLKKHGFTLQEALALMLLKSGTTFDEQAKKMMDKGYLVCPEGTVMITQTCSESLDSALLEADDDVPDEKRLLPLAKTLIALYPGGKVPGTPYYYKSNKHEVMLRLQKFFKIYGDYSDEAIIEATKRYVKSFNGDYTYMKVLKYFIYKFDRKVNAQGVTQVEETSMLSSELENLDNDYAEETDWTSEMR